MPSDTIRTYLAETVRTGRYSVIGAEPSNARRLWFIFHGYGQLAASLLRVFDGIVPADTCVVAPEGLSRFYREMPRPDGGHLQKVGASWMTRESRDAEIADALHWLDVVYRRVMSEAQQVEFVGVLGFSQGVAMATRWIQFGTPVNDRLRHVVLWAGHLATELEAAEMNTALSGARLTFVAGDQDPFFTDDAFNMLTEQLESWHSAVDIKRFPGVHQLNRALVKEFMQDLGSPV